MAAYVQGIGAFSGATLVTSLPATFASNVTAGDMIVVEMGWQDGLGGPAPSTITDSRGNTYTAAVAPVMYPSPLFYSQALYYTVNATTGPCTVTLSWGGSLSYNYVRIFAHEYSGVSLLDQVSNTQTATGTGSLTTTRAVSVVCAFLMDENPVTTIAAPFTARLTGVGSQISSDDIVSATGTYTATFTPNGGGGFVQMANFYPGAIAGTASLPLGPLSLTATGTNSGGGTVGGIPTFPLGPLTLTATSLILPTGTYARITAADRRYTSL